MASEHTYDSSCLCPRCRSTKYDLDAKCHVLWLLNGGQTEKWNGDRCDCECIQGILNCKRNEL